jgi:hypothetical protein
LKKIYCEHGSLTKNIRASCLRARVTLVHFPFDPGSQTSKIRSVANPSKAEIRDLNLPIKDLPGAIADYAGSHCWDEVLSIIGPSNRRDALHVDSAFKSGCVAFVTDDSDILEHKAQLEDLLGIRFFRPDEFSNLEQFVAGNSAVI